MNERKNFECLLPKTKKLLELLIDTAPFLSNYVFVGGSALALHICHRKSEDLDFFTYREGVFDKQEIRKYIGRFDSRVILNESDEQIDLLIDGVKVTFFDAKWKFLGIGVRYSLLIKIQYIGRIKNIKGVQCGSYYSHRHGWLLSCVKSWG